MKLAIHASQTNSALILAFSYEIEIEKATLEEAEQHVKMIAPIIGREVYGEPEEDEDYLGGAT